MLIITYVNEQLVQSPSPMQKFSSARPADAASRAHAAPAHDAARDDAAGDDAAAGGMGTEGDRRVRAGGLGGFLKWEGGPNHWIFLGFFLEQNGQDSVGFLGKPQLTDGVKDWDCSASR